MSSPEDLQNCVKCDILLCHELSVSSSVIFFSIFSSIFPSLICLIFQHAELQKFNPEQRESVKRNLSFSEDTNWFRNQYDSESEISLTTTQSNESFGEDNQPISSSPETVPTEEHPTVKESEKEIDSELTDDCGEQEDIYCDEALSPSPKPKLAYLRKRQRSSANALASASSGSYVKVAKKKRIA